MKQMIWMGVIIGSTIGGYIPTLWGADLFSFSTILFSGLGAFAGIWVGYQLSKW